MVAGRSCSRMAPIDHYYCSSLFRYKKSKLVLKKLKVADFQSRKLSGFQATSSHIRLHLPKDLVFEIFVRLPAKSVARFRCVSTTWLSITTDPSFILAHARRAQKSLLVRSYPVLRSMSHFNTRLISFSLSGYLCCKRNIDLTTDVALSSLDGLVLFSRKIHNLLPSDSNYYVINPLIGLHIDLPNPNVISFRSIKTMDLYYHRWSGEYRILNLIECIEGLDCCHAEVLSLRGASSSWRQIKAKAPLGDVLKLHRRIQVNDSFYWICRECTDTPIILVFDIFKESFSLMELPSYSQKSNFPSFVFGSHLKYGLVSMEGNLFLWFVYRDKSCARNVMIDIWAAVDGDEKWKNTYSLCLVDEWRWALNYSFQSYRLIDCCFCFREQELIFLFDGNNPRIEKDKTGKFAPYLLHWNLKSGIYRKEQIPLSEFEAMYPLALVCKETLITSPFNHTITTDDLA